MYIFYNLSPITWCLYLFSKIYSLIRVSLHRLELLGWLDNNKDIMYHEAMRVSPQHTSHPVTQSCIITSSSNVSKLLVFLHSQIGHVKFTCDTQLKQREKKRKEREEKMEEERERDRRREKG